MTVNSTRLLDNLINIKNILNFNFLVCHDTFFSKEGLIKNIGFYIFNLIISYHIVNTIMFYLKYFNLLQNKIKDIVKAVEFRKLVYEKKEVNLITKENDLIEK